MGSLVSIFVRTDWTRPRVKWFTFETGFAFQPRNAVGGGHSLAALLLDAWEKITVTASALAFVIACVVVTDSWSYLRPFGFLLRL